MSNYQGVYMPGGTYFFTLITYNRLSFLTHKDVRTTLRMTWQSVKKKYLFVLIALCLLPDHLHCMWRLPDTDADYSIRWQKIKKGFSKKLNRSIITHADTSQLRRSRREAPVWQRRFWEYTIRDQQDDNRHVDYIHLNPVKHGYVRKAIEWPWSTFHRYLSSGIYDSDWGDVSSNQELMLNTAGE